MVSDEYQGTGGEVVNPRTAKYASRKKGASNDKRKIKRILKLEEEVDSEEVFIKSKPNRKVKPPEENVSVSKGLQKQTKIIKPTSRTTKSVQREETTKVASKSVATKRADKGISLRGKKPK